MADGRGVGADTIKAAVSDFYDSVLDDPELAGWFEGVDMRRLRAHQTAFLLFALGGPEGYAGRPLREVHAGLQITDAAFDGIIEHLMRSLDDAGMAGDVTRQLRARLERTRPQIVEA